MLEKGTQVPSPSPDLIPAGTVKGAVRAKLCSVTFPSEATRSGILIVAHQSHRNRTRNVIPLTQLRGRAFNRHLERADNYPQNCDYPYFDRIVSVGIVSQATLAR